MHLAFLRKQTPTCKNKLTDATYRRSASSKSPDILHADPKDREARASATGLQLAECCAITLLRMLCIMQMNRAECLTHRKGSCFRALFEQSMSYMSCLDMTLKKCLVHVLHVERVSALCERAVRGPNLLDHGPVSSRSSQFFWSL